jgi:hypothetical protein
LELLENSQIQLADLAKAENRTDNIADALEDWAKKIGELGRECLSFSGAHDSSRFEINPSKRRIASYARSGIGERA